MKKLLIHGILAGLLSGIIGVIYLHIYQEALGTNFNQIINKSSIISASIIGCLIMTIGYTAIFKLKKQTWIGWVNLLIIILSFASVIGPIGMSLPLNIEYPELFPGLVVPMHFLPALVFLGIYPFFQKKILS